MFGKNKRPNRLEQRRKQQKDNNAMLSLMIKTKTFAIEAATKLEAYPETMVAVSEQIYEWMTSKPDPRMADLATMLKAKMYAFEKVISSPTGNMPHIIKVANETYDWITAKEDGDIKVNISVLNARLYALETAANLEENFDSVQMTAREIYKFLKILGDTPNDKEDMMMETKEFCLDMAMKSCGGQYNEKAIDTCVDLYHWITRQGKYKTEDAVKLEMVKKDFEKGKGAIIIPPSFKNTIH